MGTTEDEIVGWHHQLNGYEFEQVPGVGDGQGSLAFCSPWGPKSRMQLNNWTELNLWSNNDLAKQLLISSRKSVLDNLLIDEIRVIKRISEEYYTVLIYNFFFFPLSYLILSKTLVVYRWGFWNWQVLISLLMVRFPLKLWSSILFPGLLSSPCSISPGCPCTDMSEGKIWNKVSTRLIGESLERQSLLLLWRTFSPATQDGRMLGLGCHRTFCHQFIPFHTKPWASGCPEMALTIEGAWCHHFIKPQPGTECLPLQKQTWTSIRRRAHFPIPVWSVCWKKNN